MPSFAKFDTWTDRLGISYNNLVKIDHFRHDPDNDSYTTISQDVRAYSPLIANYTPKLSNSRLYITGRMHVRMVNANGMTFGLTQDGVDLDGMINRSGKDFHYKNDSVNHHYTGHCEAWILSTGRPTIFTIWAQGWSGGTWELSYGHGEHIITVMEFAQ
jgi:hypothetical protein